MVRVRLAPSPTGTLHIGTARTAVFNWLFAKSQNGVFLLRIEDTDKERSKPEFTQNILEGLQWLGIDCAEDPVIQSERVVQHRDAIRTLLDKGLAYRCYANESELAAMRDAQKAAKQAPRYDNRHRNLTAEQEAEFQAEGRDAVIRFRINDDADIHWNDWYAEQCVGAGAILVVTWWSPDVLLRIKSVIRSTTSWLWWTTPPWRSPM